MGIVTLVVVIGGMHIIPNGIEINKEPIEIEKEIDVLQKRIDEALTASQASTTAKAQEAYDNVIKAEKERIKDQVKAEYIKEIEKSMSAE